MKKSFLLQKLLLKKVIKVYLERTRTKLKTTKNYFG